MHNPPFQIGSAETTFSKSKCMSNLEGELGKDEGNPGLGHQVGQAGVPGRVELESAVQSRYYVRGAVARAVHVVLVQLGRFKAVPDLSQNNFVLIVIHG